MRNSNKTTNITDGQRKLFFRFKSVFGRERVYSVLLEVTRGIKSLRDPRLSVGMMNDVIGGLFWKYRLPPMKHNRQGHKIQKGKQELSLVSRDKQEAIRTLLGVAGLQEKDVSGICQEWFQKDGPVTDIEATKLIEALQNIIRERYEKRRTSWAEKAQVI